MPNYAQFVPRVFFGLKKVHNVLMYKMLQEKCKEYNKTKSLHNYLMIIELNSILTRFCLRANSATKCHIVPNVYFVDNQAVKFLSWHDLAQSILLPKKVFNYLINRFLQN